MSPDDLTALYLEGERVEVPGDTDRLDAIRSALGDRATWAQPPHDVADGLWDRIRSDGVTDTNVTPIDRSRWPAVLTTVGVIAALIALVLATVSTFANDGSEEFSIAMSGTELSPGAFATASVRPTGSGWWIHLDISDLDPAPAGTYYEGWVWSGDDEGVSVGTFHMRGGDESVILWAGVDLEEYPGLRVTLQDEGEGSAASDRVVLTGTWGG
jgi:Anti-sigma-K factor rskA, C-terminal